MWIMGLVYLVHNVVKKEKSGGSHSRVNNLKHTATDPRDRDACALEWVWLL